MCASVCRDAWHSLQRVLKRIVPAFPNAKHALRDECHFRGAALWSGISQWPRVCTEVQMPGLQGKCLVTFASPLNAVRFCHVTQVALMFAKWPADGQHICGPEEHNVEGRLLFAGPRVAMALHSSADYTCALLGVPCLVRALLQVHHPMPFCVKLEGSGLLWRALCNTGDDSARFHTHMGRCAQV